MRWPASPDHKNNLSEEHRSGAGPLVEGFDQSAERPTSENRSACLEAALGIPDLALNDRIEDRA
jgi:hypothetical protein